MAFPLMLLLLPAVAAALLVASGVAYQIVGVRRDATRVAPPGRLVCVGSHRLHLDARGSGDPPVVFESGIAASSLNWRTMLLEVATFTRAVAYDRAGLGWSERARAFTPTAAACAAQLRHALLGAGVRPPWVLVGHSFGSYVIQVFASRWPAEVGGVVLVDPITWQDWIAPDGERRRVLRGGALFAAAGALLSSLGLVRFLLRRLRSGRAGMPRAVLASFGSAATEAVTRIVGEVTKMSPDVWPAVQAHWSRPRAFLSMAAHFRALPASAREVRDAVSPLEGEAPPAARWSFPLVVLGAAAPGSVEQRRQESLARLSTRGRFVTVADCGHWVHLDAPALVLVEIRAVVEELRGAAAATGTERGTAAHPPST